VGEDPGLQAASRIAGCAPTTHPVWVTGNALSPHDASFAFMDSGREGGLVADSQLGDGTAFLQLVRHYQRPLYRLIYAMTRSEADAAALTEEAFVRAWSRLREYPTGRRFFPWLLRVARDLPLAPAAPRGARDGEDPVLRAFAELRQDEQLALALHATGPFRYEDIAALLDVPIGITFLRISQARASMLGRTGGEGEGEP